MKISVISAVNKIRAITISIVMIPLFLTYNVYGQVAQRWLKSWNKANTMKPSKISAISRIAPENEPGTPFVIKGSVFTPDETPAVGVIVHSYHRDAKGYDFGENDAELDTWRLQGWAKTDEQGNFEFKTIRPAPDHIGREGPHIHFTTVSDMFGRQWAKKVFLSDDPTLTETQRLDAKKAGKFNWIADVRETDGIQYIKVNIKLKKKGDF